MCSLASCIHTDDEALIKSPASLKASKPGGRQGEGAVSGSTCLRNGRRGSILYIGCLLPSLINRVHITTKMTTTTMIIALSANAVHIVTDRSKVPLPVCLERLVCRPVILHRHPHIAVDVSSHALKFQVGYTYVCKDTHTYTHALMHASRAPAPYPRHTNLIRHEKITLSFAMNILRERCSCSLRREWVKG